MNTPNDAANAEDFEALYLAYKAKYEAALKDAERYRWLREHSCQHDSNGNDAESWSTHSDPSSLDDIIDAAIAGLS